VQPALPSLRIKPNRPDPLIPCKTAALAWQRGAVEREFGRLEAQWALTLLRVRGIERV
jgi:hypothetical protein